MLLRLARVFLAVALLVAAQGALEHPLAHLGEAHAHAAHGDACAHDDGDAPARSHACDLCVAFGSLSTGASAGLALAVDAPAAPQPSAAALGRFLPRAPPAFRSQAPPLHA